MWYVILFWKLDYSFLICFIIFELRIINKSIRMCGYKIVLFNEKKIRKEKERNSIVD